MGLFSAALLISRTKLGHGPLSSSSNLGVFGICLSSPMIVAPLLSPSPGYPLGGERVGSGSFALPHLDIPAGTLLRTFLAALTKLQLEAVHLPRLEGFHHRLVLAVLPAVVA